MPTITDNSRIDNLFGVKIFYKILPNLEEENKKIINRLYLIKKNDPKGVNRSNQLGWHSHTDLMQFPELDEFKKHLNFTLGEIFTYYDYKHGYKLELDTCWGNINPKYGFNTTHSHPSCLWSGVYYLQVPENCGNIYFVDPIKPRIHYGAQYNNENSELASTSIFYKPQVSKLIIFPAYLEHFVRPNLSDTDRISLSFNIRLNEYK
jgi:uncharacterized protein (TIGR02466 family)